MTRLRWGKVGDKHYEDGVDRGVLYPGVDPGVIWNGLVAVKENPDGAGVTKGFFDGAPYSQTQAVEGFSATIDAFTYPDEFSQFDGFVGIVGQQKRESFGFSYRTGLGNDKNGLDHGYKIHLVYNALAEPTQKAYSTEDASPDAEVFSWRVTTTPIQIDEHTGSSHLIIDSTKAYAWVISALEDLLYGTFNTSPRLPTPWEILDLFETNAILQIIDHGDGTWTAIGPDNVVSMLDATTFQINWPTAVYIDAVTYTVSTL